MSASNVTERALSTHSCRSSMELAKSAYLPKAANVFWLVQNSTKLLFSTVFGVAAIRLALGGN